MKTLPLLCASALLAGLPTLAAAAPLPEPLVRCLVTYAGSTHTVEARVVPDPYPVPAVDIGGRFRFKAVMVGQGTQVEYIKLYSYLETRRQPVLVQQARYLPPFPAPRPGQESADLTGMQHLFAGPVERELQYHCTLQGVQP
jgi:hypothetical protein